MATKVLEENWSPLNNTSSNYKPAKLARYSFNYINYQSSDVKIGYKYNTSLEADDDYNLTDYIPVSSGYTYWFKSNSDVGRGIKYLAYFDENKNYVSTFEASMPGTSIVVIIPSGVYYLKATMYKDAWEKTTMNSNSSPFGYKDIVPHKIVNNKIGEKIYEDLHLEVYVKAEAIIKDFVNCFNLRDFQSFPSSYYYWWYEETNSILFKSYTYPYYTTKYTFNNFVANYNYNVGDKIKGTYQSYFGIEYYLICMEAHTSANTFNDEIDNNRSKWFSVSGDEGYWLTVNKNVKESNYDEKIGFPYVGSLLFKNLWGCDMSNYLEAFVNKANLTIYYHRFFARNLRTSQTYYNKFFNQGYFDAAANYSDVEGFGVRLIRGDSFRNDEILGDLIANNYLTYSESKHNIPNNWNYNNDSVVTNYFKGGVTDPFDHYYQFTPKIGMPFFKEKVFEDFKIELVLQKEDVLGNLIQRIVDLPILVTFYNNLIKVYWGDYDANNLKILQFYKSEYINSNVEHSFTAYANGNNIVTCSTIWCPNVDKLSVSTTVIGPLGIQEGQEPRMIKKNGQTCILTATMAGTTTVGTVMKFIHTIEYSDGENYDKFIYIEKTTFVAPPQQ